ncbi:MAG: hypothetical protein WCG27_10395 [Pseudomonadota bacterium]
MKNECSHVHTKKQKIEREFQGEAFSALGTSCQDCGATLWDHALEKKYNNWLEDLHRKKRHIFQIQYSLSDSAIQCIKKLSERFPGADESLIIRALVIVQLDIVESNVTIMKKLHFHMKTADYEILTGGKKVAKKLQFGPSGLQEILSLASLAHIKPHKLVEESIGRILLLSIKENPEMHSFWENVVLKNIETILKAA